MRSTIESVERKRAAQKRAEKLVNYYPVLIFSERTDDRYGTYEVLECADCDYWQYLENVRGGCSACGYTYRQTQESDS